MTNKPQPCHCNAYPFPHRVGGGNCEGETLCKHGYPGYNDYDEWDNCCPDGCHDDQMPYEDNPCLTAGERNPSMCRR